MNFTHFKVFKIKNKYEQRRQYKFEISAILQPALCTQLHCTQFPCLENSLLFNYRLGKQRIRRIKREAMLQEAERPSIYSLS